MATVITDAETDNRMRGSETITIHSIIIFISNLMFLTVLGIIPIT